MTTQHGAHAAPAQQMPAQQMPAQPMPAQPMPAQQMPAQPGHPFGAPYSQPQAAATPKPKWHSTVWTLGLASIAAVLAGLSIPENGSSAWTSVHAWGGLAILGAVLTLAPVASGSLDRQRAWQVSACGAGALVLFWVLFTLPSVGSNTSLAVTVGVAAGVIAAWIVPGRDSEPAGASGAGPNHSVPAAPRGHTW